MMKSGMMLAGLMAMASSADGLWGINELPRREAYKAKIHKQKMNKAKKNKLKQQKASKKRNRK